MAVNKRLLQGAAAAPGGLVPSEHFGVVLYEGDGSTSHSINGGKFGAAFYGNGSDSRIDVSSIGGFPSGNAPRSISFWMYSDSYANGGIVAYGTAASNQGFAFYISSSQLIMTFYAVNANINYALSTGQWYHVVATHDGTTFKAYINGSEEYSDTRTLNTGTAGFRIGGVPWNNSAEFFNGKLDQVRVFQKALSSSEVSTLYAETVDTVESLDPLSEDTTDTLQVLGDSSCIATYRFENDEIDLSGNYNGTGTAIQYAAGRYGQAADFNGSSSNVELPTGSPFNDSDTIKSISAWVKADTTSSRVYPFSIGSTTTDNQFFNFGYLGDSNNILVFMRNGSNSNQAYHSASTTTDTNWHHIVVQTTGSAVEIYLDGESQSVSSTYAGSGSASSWISYINYTGTVRANIGTNASFGPQYSNGQIDQVRFFNKALSAAEVTTLYNENPLVASYRFEGNANDDMRAYDGTASNVTYEYGLGFTPDLVWIKNRDSSSYFHELHDSTRGASKAVSSNSSIAEFTDAGRLLSFDTGGFSVGNINTNKSADDYVAWAWKANGGTTSSNTDGDITSTVQANQTAGFSIVTYTGNGTQPSSIGHGLSSAPTIVMNKCLSLAGTNWHVYTSSTGATSSLVLNDTAAAYTGVGEWNTAPDSTRIYVGNTNTNASGRSYISYCFHDVDGFSKFGSYTGNGSTNIIETGFEPAFLMVKKTNNTGSWTMFDNKRDLTNPRKKYLKANTNDAEGTVSDGYYFNSNGFTLTTTSGNDNGDTYIYMAFAADPDTEAPTVAKSFSTVAYTGTQATLSIDSLGFKPGLVWLKNRDITGYNHFFYDIVRGPGEAINTNFNVAEYSLTGVSSFDDDGFTLGSNYETNRSGDNHIAWVWKADDNEPTINTEGSIDSIVSANANAGFSIVKYEGNSTAGTTIGHGLSAVPQMIIVKRLESPNDNWAVYNETIGNTKRLALDENGAAASNRLEWNSTTPSATTFTLGNHSAVNTGSSYIAYCFHSVSGYSKIGSYTGNGSSTSVTTGFQPDFVMLKRTSAIGNWNIWDSVRNGSSSSNDILYPNKSDAETDAGSGRYITFNSNGFTIYGDSGDSNANEHTYIYMAFKIN
jgi:hypothetical protein